MFIRSLRCWGSNCREIDSLFGSGRRRRRRRRGTFLDKVSYVVGKETFEFGTFVTVGDKVGSVTWKRTEHDGEEKRAHIGRPS